MEHFENGDLHDDPSWYALRNAVYATGCRTLLAKENSSSWTEVQQKSWPYFENALSVYVELLYTPTGLTAVRALAAMVRATTFISQRSLLLTISLSRTSISKVPGTQPLRP